MAFNAQKFTRLLAFLVMLTSGNDEIDALFCQPQRDANGGGSLPCRNELLYG
jgi:hypothetical protein